MEKWPRVYTRHCRFLNAIKVWICLQLAPPSTFLSLRRPSGEFQTALRVCCYSAEVAVSGSPQSPGGEERKERHKEDEKKRRRGEEKWGIRGKCVPGVYTARPLCIQECVCSILWALALCWVLWVRTKPSSSAQTGGAGPWLYLISDCRGWMEMVEGLLSGVQTKKEVRPVSSCTLSLTDATSRANSPLPNYSIIFYLSLYVNIPGFHAAVKCRYLLIWHCKLATNCLLSSWTMTWEMHLCFLRIFI